MSTLLLIEDDELSREVLSIQLAAAGFQVRTAEDGGSAFACLGENPSPPEIILADLQLPGITGNALALRLRRLCRGSILLAISGSRPATESWEQFDGFLLKPFATEDLTAILQQRPLEPSSSIRATKSDIVPLDESIYRALLASMPGPQLLQLYELCLSDAEARIVSMRQAGEALDGALFRHQAHTIRGSCSMVGATELERLAAFLEENGLDATNYVASLKEMLDCCGRLRGMLFARRGGQENCSENVSEGVA